MDRDCDKHCNGDVASKYSGCCCVCSEVCKYFLTKKALDLEAEEYKFMEMRFAMFIKPGNMS